MNKHTLGINSEEQKKKKKTDRKAVWNTTREIARENKLT